MKKQFYPLLLFIIIILFLSLYESEEMVQITLFKTGDESNSRTILHYLLILTTFSVGFCMFHSKPRDSFFVAFCCYLLYAWVVSIVIEWDAKSANGLFVYSIPILLPIFFWWYFYHVHQMIDNNVMMFLLLLSCVIMMRGFVNSYQLYVVSNLMKEGNATSSAYSFLYILPFFLSSTKKIFKIIGILFVIILTVFSMKRGGIIALSLGLFLYYIVDRHCSKKNMKTKVILMSLLVTVVVYVVLTFFMQEYIDTIFQRLNSVKEDEGSGRLEIMATTWEMIIHSDFSSLVFGHGWSSVIEKHNMGVSAHNDILEVLYDFGIIGLSLYIWFVVEMYKTAIKMIRKHSQNAPAFMFSVVVFSANSLYSHIIIYSFNLILFASVWGYIVGKENNESTLKIRYI